MRTFPIFLCLEKKIVLLVGVSSMTESKRHLLEAAGATVVQIPFHEFDLKDTTGKTLVFSATGNNEHDFEISKAARAAGVLVNVVDRPELSDFIMPAIIDRDEIVIAVSTHGGSPVLAQRLRAIIEVALPHGIERVARFARRFRSAVRARIDDHDHRRHFWESFFDGPIAKALLAGREREARQRMIRKINSDLSRESGFVADLLIDPDDAGQMTLKDLRILQQADIVFFSAEISSEIINLARRDAIRAAWQGQAIEADKRVVRLIARSTKNNPNPDALRLAQ